MVCYDADSRPATDSLACFAQAITADPAADVFHQSSRFRFQTSRTSGPLRQIRDVVCDASALRANRFVLGFEIPRLANRSSRTRAIKRAAASLVYAHVTAIPVASLDQADMPDTIRGIIDQAARWFAGPARITRT